MTKIRFFVTSEDGETEQIEEHRGLNPGNYGWLVSHSYVGQPIEYGNGAESAKACIFRFAYEWETDRCVVEGEPGDYLVVGEGYMYPQDQETFEDRFSISSPAEVEELVNWTRETIGVRGNVGPTCDVGVKIQRDGMSPGPSPVARRIAIDFIHICEKRNWDEGDRSKIMCEMIRSYTAHQSPFLE